MKQILCRTLSWSLLLSMGLLFSCGNADPTGSDTTAADAATTTAAETLSPLEQLEKKVENQSSATKRIPVLEEQLHSMGQRVDRLEKRVELLENRLDMCRRENGGRG